MLSSAFIWCNWKKRVFCSHIRDHRKSSQKPTKQRKLASGLTPSPLKLKKSCKWGFMHWAWADVNIYFKWTPPPPRNFLRLGDFCEFCDGPLSLILHISNNSTHLDPFNLFQPLPKGSCKCPNIFKATFPPNISIEKFCQSAKRIIGMSSAAVVRDVFATTASFKRCTVLHNAFPVCTTVYVFQANSTRTFAPARRRVVHYKTLVLITQYPRGCWIQEGKRYTPWRTTTVESENGLRKICFVQKIDLESRREGLLFCAR